MKYLLTMALFVLPGISFAQYHYDYKTGNSYNVQRTYGGGAAINGFNTRTNSTWNTRVQPNGNMSGMDAGGNYWNYNKSTGSYWNSNGTSCFGKGQFRQCY